MKSNSGAGVDIGHITLAPNSTDLNEEAFNTTRVPVLRVGVQAEANTAEPATFAKYAKAYLSGLEIYETPSSSDAVITLDNLGNITATGNVGCVDLTASGDINARNYVVDQGNLKFKKTNTIGVTDDPDATHWEINKTDDDNLHTKTDDGNLKN